MEKYLSYKIALCLTFFMSLVFSYVLDVTKIEAVTGDVIDLNFFVSNLTPWIQVTCGDARIESGISNILPSGKTMILSGAGCANPGVIFTGGTTASFGQGSASTSNLVVGGNSYPEVYSSSTNGSVLSSINLTKKANAVNITATNLSSLTGCSTLTNCTLPANLPHGLYQANGNVTLNAYTFPAGQNYIFLVNGNLTINGNLIIPANAGSSVIYSVSGNIIVASTVGSAASSTTPNISGILSADKSFVMQSTGSCPDLRLNVEGSIIANAARGGGSLQNNRDLCGSDATYPTLEITQRLDMLLNLPDLIKTQSITSHEVAP
jgi:hypothetical protein